MNDFQILPDDPRLTAYALGELDGEDLAAIEAALRAAPELRATVDAIRATVEKMEAALAAEADGAIAVERVTASLAGSPAVVASDAIDPSGRAFAGTVNGYAKRAAAPALEIDEYRRLTRGSWGQLVRFPQFYYVIGGLAAACFAVMVAVRGPQPVRTVEKKYYVEVPLAPLESVPAGEVAAVAMPVVTDLAAASTDGALATASTSASTSMSTTPLAEAAPSVGALQLDGLRQAIAGPGQRMFDAKVTGLVEQSKQRAPAQKMSGTLALQDSGTAAPRTFSSAPTPLTAPTSREILREGFLPAAAQVATPVTKPGALQGGSAGKSLANASFSSGSLTLSGPTPAGGVSLGYSGVVGGTASSLSSLSVATRNGQLGEYPLGRPMGGRLDLYPGPRPAPTGAMNTESYAYQNDNPFLAAIANPLSTFSIDVDTASYSNVRRFIEGGRLPPPDAVRIEELVNYFPYRYPAPNDTTTATPAAAGNVAARSRADAAPFAASLEIASAPWAPTHRLVRIGLKGRTIAAAARPSANLVFLLDVSGSMRDAKRLPLVKESMRLLVEKLRPDDRVAIVTYAGNSGLALPSTPASRPREILEAIDALNAAGGTNGAMGIQLAYDIAKANFVAEGINRIVLCTDGDFNVGVASPGALVRLIEEKAKTGVFLTVLGFGIGNLKDGTLEALAAKGNGNYGYIDTRKEAEKLLGEQIDGTLVTIAKDVKIQVDFNPAKVASYRLLGYENRLLKKEDFTDDKVDAGEIGAGHTVTALYEIVPVGPPDDSVAAAPLPEESKYQPRAAAVRVPAAIAHELLTVKLRYKEPTGDVSKALEFPCTDDGRSFVAATPDFRFAAAVAAFGMVLRDSPHKGSATIGDVVAWAAAAAANPAEDPNGHRSDFIGLARQAQALMKSGD